MAFSLSDYRDIRELARGGMGKVYLATQVSLGRTVVIKEMAGGIVADEAQIMRFENEAKSGAALSHPNIIRVYDFGRDRDCFYISMEYIDGPSLQQLIERQTVPKEVCLMVLVQALKGLHFAHEQGIIHRDVKPGNVLVRSSTGEAKILDFGLAYAGSNALHLTAAEAIVGTPQYMSPEQANGGERKDLRMDIFSVGVMTYQILAGKLPFTGNTIPAVLYSITQTKEQDLQELVPWIPEDLAANIRWSLVKNPDERLASLAPLIKSLQDMFYEMRVRDPTEEVRKFLSDPRTATVGLIEQLLDYHVTRGQLSLDAGQMVKAKAHVDAALRYDPRNKDATRVMRGLGDTGITALRAATKRKARSLSRMTGGQRPRRQPLKAVAIVVGVLAVLAGIGAVAWRPCADWLFPPPVILESLPGGSHERAVSQAPADSARQSGDSSHATTLDTAHPHENASGALTDTTATALPRQPRHARNTSGDASHAHPSHSGALEVRVDPRGADVAIDGTPAALNGGTLVARVPVGQHTVVVKANGYESYIRTIEIEPNAKQSLDIALKKAGSQIGRMHVHSYPWAEIYVDGRYVGNSPTPAPIELVPGKHTLVLKREGYYVHEEVVRVVADSLLREEVQLVKLQAASKP